MTTAHFWRCDAQDCRVGPVEEGAVAWIEVEDRHLCPDHASDPRSAIRILRTTCIALRLDPDVETLANLDGMLS